MQRFQQVMSSSKADPRRPENIVPFHLPAPTEEEDLSGNIAMYVGKVISRRFHFNEQRSFHN